MFKVITLTGKASKAFSKLAEWASKYPHMTLAELLDIEIG